MQSVSLKQESPRLDLGASSPPAVDRRRLTKLSDGRHDVLAGGVLVVYHVPTDGGDRLLLSGAFGLLSGATSMSPNRLPVNMSDDESRPTPNMDHEQYVNYMHRARNEAAIKGPLTRTLPDEDEREDADDAA